VQIRSCHAPQALRLHQELRPAGSIGSVGFSYKPSSFVLIRELEWRFHYRLTRTVSTVNKRFNDTPFVNGWSRLCSCEANSGRSTKFAATHQCTRQTETVSDLPAEKRKAFKDVPSSRSARWRVSYLHLVTIFRL
jgi:hypothetical protein